jgi:hypothetical protein
MILIRINTKNLVQLQIKSIQIMMEKYPKMKCVHILSNVSSLYRFYNIQFYNVVLFREQHDREADDFIVVLDPKNTKKITFDAFIRENYGDMDIAELEKASKTDTQSRETRRVKIQLQFFA